MKTGHFVNANHRAYAILLYYTGVRKMEALRAKKEQFNTSPTTLYFDVGQRLKKGLHTAPLPIKKDRPFVDELVDVIRDTKLGDKVFKFSPKTAYLIIDRGFGKYPHYLRMTKITMLFRKRFTIDQVRSWSGHKEIGSLNSYVGYANVEEMANA